MARPATPPTPRPWERANAARLLAHDLVALERVDFGPPHPQLGPITLEPTQLRAGTARNVVPGEATAVLDVRTTPALSRREVVERIERAVAGEVRVLSDRLVPRETPESAPLVEAARAGPPRSPAVRLGHPFRHGLHGRHPGAQVRPRATERSHTPDEYVLESEILEGAPLLYPAGPGLRRDAGGGGSVSRLWDKGEPLDERVLRYTAGEDHRLDARLVPYDVRASIAHAEMLHEVGLLSAEDLEAIRVGSGGAGRGARRGRVADRARGRGRPHRAGNPPHRRIGEAGARVHLGRSRNDQVLAALRLYLRDVVGSLAAGAREVAAALDALADARGGDRPPRLHPSPAGHAQLRPALGRRLRRRAAGRRRRPRGLPPPRRQEPPGLGRRLRRPPAAHRPRSDAAQASASRRSMSR